MKPLILAISFLFFSTLSIAQYGYWQQSLQYQITVQLDDSLHTLDGTLKLHYRNNSPDTLIYIWFHTWPNAYKNDRTDFSEQLLENGRTDFYFADNKDRGYMNRMDFRVNQELAKIEDHPQYFDVIKLLLPLPLPPGEQIVITTPFHVQLPKNFSRGGHDGKTYQATQWYPKPAVYDKNGWHEMPYLDQGEFYSEFGDYEVQITLPEKYVVAATGELQNESEKLWLIEKSKLILKIPAPKPKKKSVAVKQPAKKSLTTKSGQPANNQPIATKTLIFKQARIHDFAWFANPDFIVKLDSMTLATGRTIQTNIFHLANHAEAWTNSQEYLKKAIRFHSERTGEYPYQQVTVAEGKLGFSGGMEYPTITILDGVKDAESLESLIVHEVGHNWFYGILASNERSNPWMDEGLNSYFDNRYAENNSSGQEEQKHSVPLSEQKMQQLLYETIISIHRDQPIITAADSLYKLNYPAISYYKTADWFKNLETVLGRPLFDSCIREYYQRWQFKHPQPEDLEHVFTDVSGRNLKDIFGLLTKTGSLHEPEKKKFKIRAILLAERHRQIQLYFCSALGGL